MIVQELKSLQGCSEYYESKGESVDELKMIDVHIENVDDVDVDVDIDVGVDVAVTDDVDAAITGLMKVLYHY